MADNKPELTQESTSAWLSGWWQSAKEKSTNAFEFMKRDLTEFTQVIQQDATSAVSSTAAALKEKLKVDSEESVAGRARKSLSTLVTSVSGAFYPIKENEEEEIVMIHNSQPIQLDRWQIELHKIKTDPNTFCHEPTGPPELYEAWLESFSMDDYTSEVHHIMTDYPETRIIYAKLVPMAISNLEFWQRYFFRVYQLQQEEEFLSSGEPNKEVPKSSEDDLGIVPTSSNKEETKENNGTTKTSSSSGSLCSEKEGTTGDEWEKDFEGEIKELLKGEMVEVENKIKTCEEDWENWE